MGYEPALNEDLGAVYDDELHERFSLYKDQSGKSHAHLASMLSRSTAAVSQYLSKTYKGNVPEFEKDIASLLRREEDLRFVAGPKKFCPTTASTLIWEVLQFCDERQKMGAALAPSGTGKTETIKEYKRMNRMTIFVTADITTKSPSQILRRTIEQVGGVGRCRSTSEYLQALIERLKGSRRLVILDDAHFLNWEAYELMRKIHDCAGVGIVYVGQERLYDQMRGQDGKAYLFDQIYSRIAIKRDKFQIFKKDARAIAESLCAGLDKECVDYLYSKARGKGRFRYMANLIDVAMEMNRQYEKPINVPLLQEAERFLLGE